MRRLILVLFFLLVFINSKSFASYIYFSPDFLTLDNTGIFYLDLYAVIPENEKIFGYSFDLSLDNGMTYINKPGDGNEIIKFISFNPNSQFFTYDELLPPLWDDGDTIAAEVPITHPDVYGEILLGTFIFEALMPGQASIFLGPPEGNYGPFGEEGLLGDIALMPNNPTFDLIVTPEPSTIWLVFLFILLSIAGFIKKPT